MKKIIFLFSGMSAGFLFAQEKTVNVSDLRLIGVKQEILQPLSNQSMTGDRLRIAGKRFEKGISVHAPFSANIYTGNKATKFSGFVGIDDAANRHLQPGTLDSFARTDGLKTFFYTDENSQERKIYGVGYNRNSIEPGSAEFLIYGDGKQIWTSGIMHQGDKAKKIDLDISQIKVLALKVTDAGDGISGDVADFGNLQIETGDPGSVSFVSAGFRPVFDKPEGEPSAQIKNVLQKLPVYKLQVAGQDWLLQKPIVKASVTKTADNELVLSNGLVSRTIQVIPNAATTSLKNLVTGEEYIRAVEPEAIVKIDGQDYDIGGLGGQVDRGYLLKEWLKNMYSLPGSFRLTGIAIKDIQPSIAWTANRWLPATQWKQNGKELVLSFTHPDKKGIVIEVHHKIYDNIPLISKTIRVINNSNSDIVVNRFTGEIIAYPEKENFVSNPKVAWTKPNFHIENDYAFGGMTYEESDQSVSWETDPLYTSQVNYQLQTVCVVKSGLQVGPAQSLQPGSSWKSFNTYTLLLDGMDKERNTLSQRKMYRMLAPWSTENPIFMHLTSSKPEIVKQAIDQAVATGYEMVILSFGSGLNMENQSDSNLSKFKSLATYAHNRGIQMGGYSLFSSRSIGPDVDVIDVKTGKPGGATFGNAPCLGSQWGIDYLKKLQHFYSYTGFDLLEHDGPYPGDFCASRNHPGHTGYFDSQWKQWKQSVDFYQWLRAKDIYMNVPDFYILSGSNKSGIGYREVNWSLPRDQQLILGRQNIYDGTWTRTPSMGWTFVPLVQYQGGGTAATIEPLSEHLDAYGAHMEQNYGAGVQACYRGNRLYDTEATKKLVAEKIAQYKKYRDILNADIIHLQRPTGRDWDGFMHADPSLQQKGYVLLFNPLKTDIRRTIELPLYYTGISGTARVSVNGKAVGNYHLNEQKKIAVTVTIPASGTTWMLVEAAD